MLALVKKPRIEISIRGKRAGEVIAWIEKKFEVSVVPGSEVADSISIEDTDFWKEMEKNRVGNLLAGARLKAQLTQTQLAAKLHIRQNMISDYECGRRRISPAMAKRFSAALRINEKHLSYGNEE